MYICITKGQKDMFNQSSNYFYYYYFFSNGEER